MKREKARAGYILVTVAILLVVLLGFTALAIDVGLLYGARTQSQRAADAAALAGAITFVVNPLAPQPATAKAQAEKVATSNLAMATLISSGEVNAVPDVANRRVTVDITRSEPTLFAKIFNVSSTQVHTRAVAEAAQNSTAASCTKPWFIPNTMAGTSDPCGPGGACATGQVLVVGGQPTMFAQTKFGTQFRLKPQSPSGAIAPSQFYAIQIGGPGASDYRDAISTCVSDAVLACQNSYEVKTGNMVGPTRQGVEALVGDPPRDTYVARGQYRHPDNRIYDTSTALVVAPIVDLCNYPGFCPNNELPPGGNVQLTVVGFALVFVEGIQNGGPFDGDVVGRLIDVYSCGTVPPVSGATTYSLPVRLVRVP